MTAAILALFASESAEVGGFAAWIADPYTWTTTALLIFFGILAYFGVHKTVLKALDDRAASIEAELQRAKDLRKEAQKALAEAERREKEAQAQADATLEQAKAEAKQLIEDARRDLAETVARREAMAEQRIARAEADASRDVTVAAADLAARMAEKVVAARLAADGHAASFRTGVEEVAAALKAR